MPDALATAIVFAAVLVPLVGAWTRRPAVTAMAGRRTAGLLLVGAAAAVAAAIALPDSLRLPLIDLIPAWEGAVALTLLVDRVSLVMAALIGVVGAAVTAYGGRQLLGEQGRTGFLRALAATIACAQLLVLSGNLAQLALCWLGVSAGLHRLLLHHGWRPRAVLAAHHKFLVSRLGDVGMLIAIGVLFATFGTLDLQALAERAAGIDAAARTALTIAALGLALAAMAKSAQLPLHGWLPETLEAPTPVSALMHAGIVNGGGFLLIRVSPLLAETPLALGVLVVVGLATAVVGVLAMWAQTDVKKALAWSTVAQMGFMVLECGLGAFAAALIHLVGHGLYKAHAFLRSGSVAAAVMPTVPRKGTPAAALVRTGLASAVGIGAVLGLHASTGTTPAAEPGGLILALVVGLACGQLLAAPGALLRRIGVATVFVLAAVPGLHALHAWLAPGIAVAPDLLARGAVGLGLAALVAGVLIALAALSAALPWFAHSATGRALRVHAHQGFYVGLLVERLVRAAWPPRPTPIPAGALP